MATFSSQIPIVSTNASWVLENRYGDSDPNTGILAAMQFPLIGTYRMRGYDTGLSQTVYWQAGFLDTAGTQYGGVGPLTNIVLISKGIG